MRAHTEHPRMSLFGKSETKENRGLDTAFIGFLLTSARGYITNPTATKPCDYHTVAHMTGVLLWLAKTFGNQASWFPSFSSEC